MRITSRFRELMFATHESRPDERWNNECAILIGGGTATILNQSLCDERVCIASVDGPGKAALIAGNQIPKDIFFFARKAIKVTQYSPLSSLFVDAFQRPAVEAAGHSPEGFKEGQGCDRGSDEPHDSPATSLRGSDTAVEKRIAHAIVSAAARQAATLSAAESQPMSTISGSVVDNRLWYIKTGVKLLFARVFTRDAEMTETKGFNGPWSPPGPTIPSEA